jgi:TANFOR domain-containing protein
MKSTFYLLLAALWLVVFGVQAQTPTVRVNVNLLPPYSTHLADYVDQPGRLLVTVTNLRATAIDVQFAAALSSDAGIRVFTKSGYQSSRPFTLDALQTRQLGQDELKDLFDANSLTYEGLSVADIARGGGLPEGTYTICVQALDYATRQPLSADAPGGCSRPVRLASLEAPYLIRPVPDEVVRVNGPQNILFTWARPAGAPPTTEYLFRLVEMSGNQRNPNDAFLSATVPVLYERTVTGAPSLLYSPAEPALILGRRYAFAVQAVDPVGNTLFRNNGRSEVQAFTYGTVPVAAVVPVTPVVVPLPVVAQSDSLTSIITGSLKWGWRACEETDAALTTVPSSSASVSGLALQALRDPNAGQNAAEALIRSLVTINTYTDKSAYVNGYNTGYASTYVADATKALTKADGAAKVLGRVTAVSSGGTSTTSVGPAAAGGSTGQQLPPLLGRARYPMAGITVRLVLDYDATISAQWVKNKGGYMILKPAYKEARHKVVGTATTDSEGNFAVAVLAKPTNGVLKFSEGSATYPIFQLRVEMDDLHFYNEPGGYPVTAAGPGFTVGEAVCMAKSYRLLVKVVDAQGRPDPNAQVQVGRAPVWYASAPYVTAEGNLPLAGRPTLPAASAGGPVAQQLGPASAPTRAIVVAQSAAGKPITRLLTNAGGANDEYWVRIEGAGAVPLTTKLSAWPSGDDFRAGIVTITSTYVVETAPAQVRGRVRERPGGAPVANATVELWPANTSKQVTKSYIIKSYAGGVLTGTRDVSIAVTTRTDANGYFNIPLANSNLRAGTPLSLEVTSTAGLSVWRDNLVVAADGPGRVVTRDTIRLDRITFPVAGIVRTAAATGSGSGGLRLATLRWASGGGTFLTDDRGRFLTTHPAGTDTLLISKLGYVTRRVGVTVGGTGAITTTTAKLTDVLATLNARLQPAGEPAYILPGLNKPLTNVDALQGWTLKMRAKGTPFGQALDMGLLELVRPTGNLRVAVTAGLGGPPLAGALVTLAGYNPARTETTDASGLARFSALSEGLQTLLVRGPAGSSYMLGQRDVWVVADGPATVTTVALVAGGIVRGTVQRGAQPLAGAHVLVRGRPELEATTGPDGRYELLGVPLAPWSLDATGPGATGQTRIATLATAGQAVTVDFTLTPFDDNLAPTHLLGFPIEVSSLRMVGTDAVVSGYFVRLPNNATFTADNSPRLGFTNVTVQAGADGNLRPKGQDYVVTDATELDLHAFGYLPVRLRDPAGLRVALAGTDPTQGQLIGTPEVLLSTFAPGLDWASGSALYLSAGAGTGPPPAVVVLTASGTLANPPGRLRAPTTVSCANLYGFAADIDPTQSTAGPDGLHLAGQVACNIVANQAPKLALTDLWLDAQAAIKRATLNMSTPVAVAVSGFRFALKTGELTNDGFRLGGSLTVSPKSSATTVLNFDDLLVSRSAAGASATYGGSFVIPATGVDVFNVVKFMPVADTPISFGAVADKPSTLFVKGAAEVSMLLIDRKLEVKSFEVRSDNDFEATVRPDLEATFLKGLATITLTEVSFNTIGGVSVDVDGDVQLALPLVQAAVGGIHYRPGTSRPIVSVDSVGLTVPIKVGELAGYVLYKETQETVNGQTATLTAFGGNLKIDLKKFMTLEATFKYTNSRVSNYKEFSVDISSKFPAVPLAPGLSLIGVGGGVTYRTDIGIGRVTISGSVSLGARGTVDLDPLALTVAQGPVITGSATLVVSTKKVAESTITLDFPNSLISVQVKSSIEVLPGMDAATVNGIVVLSGKRNDTYWVMGITANAKMAGLFEANTLMVMGGGLNVNDHPELNAYTSFVDRSYLTNGTTLNGAHAKGYARVGRTPETAFGVRFWEVSGRVWYGAGGDVLLNSNFSTKRTSINMICYWGGGAEVSIMGKSIGGAEVLATGNLNGTYTPSAGWNMNGAVAASMRVWFGSCGGGCSNGICWGGCFNPCFWGSCRICPVPVGGRACLRPSLTVGYRSQTRQVTTSMRY